MMGKLNNRDDIVPLFLRTFPRPLCVGWRKFAVWCAVTAEAVGTAGPVNIIEWGEGQIRLADDMDIEP